MVDIKDISGNILFSTPINEDSKRKFTLQKEDYITLKFSLDEPVYFKLGDGIDDEEIGFFELVDLYKPIKNEGNSGYDYELRLDAYYWKWKNKKFKYTPESGGKEASWNLTATLDVHLGIFLRNLTALGYTYRGVAFQFSIDSTVENSVKLVSYDNTNMIDALTAMAEAWDCEWWVTDNIIHFGRCEFGDPVDFEIGVNVTSIPRSDSQTDYATRIIAFGSTKNIPTNYRPVDDQIIVNGVVQKRLMLPEGTPCVDAYENMSEEEAVEDIVVFDDVYPRFVGTIAEITQTIGNYLDENNNPTGETYPIYTFKDTTLKNFTKDYLLDELRLIFQSGSLNGLDFALTLKSSDDTGTTFEIVRNDNYGRDLPDDTLRPVVGDTYSLYGFDTSFISDEMLPVAEQELKERTEAYIAKTKIDPSTYDNKMMSDYMYNNGTPRTFAAGDKVNLINKGYFKDGRVSRIIGFEYNLDYPYDNPVYTVGETAAYSRIGDIEDKVDAVTYKGQTYTGNGSGVYIIRTNDKTIPTDSNVFSAKESLNRFLRKDKEDSTNFLVSFLGGLISGLYTEGSETGSKLHSDGLAELGRLQVNGNSEFRKNLVSKDYISGFTTGKGWALLIQEVVNALGVKENKSTLEVDNAIIRGSLRVFEFIVSQMLGENDNRIFSGMMEVDHYDSTSGRVYLKTENGKLYNPFRAGDYIIVQQYNGSPSVENNNYVTKTYELVITSVGTGDTSAGENRLDWVTFKKFSSTMDGASTSLITEGDTFVRIDNATDTDRKGIMQIMSVGNKTPYLDVAYGLKTDPDNALKTRIGNLQGIYNHLFGWLQDFGAYVINLYAVGEYRQRSTGEDLNSKIDMLRGMFATNYQKIIYQLTEDDNYLKNATFTESLDGWTFANDSQFVTLNDELIYLNSPLVTRLQIAQVQQYDGKNMLRLTNSYVRQANFLIKKPGMHKEYTAGSAETSSAYTEVKNELYMSVKFLCRESGTLTMGFEGAGTADANAMPYIQAAITADTDWQILQHSGTWDSVGDFLLQFTGDMYISELAITDHPLDEYKKEVSTSIVQTATNIQLLGNNIDTLKGTVTKLGIDLDVANESITLYADKTDKLENSVTQLGVRISAAESNITFYANRITATETAISQLTVKTDGLTSSVTSVQGDITTANSRISTLEGKVGKAETYTQSSNPWSSWSGGTESQHVGAVWHNTSDGNTYRYIGYDNSNSWENITDIVSSASYVSQNKDKISTVVGGFDASGNLINYTGLVTTATAASLFAEHFNSDGSLINTTGLVLRDNVISMYAFDATGNLKSLVTQTAATFKIQASQISLIGYTDINNNFQIAEAGSIYLYRGASFTSYRDDAAGTNGLPYDYAQINAGNSSGYIYAHCTLENSVAAYFSAVGSSKMALKVEGGALFDRLGMKTDTFSYNGGAIDGQVIIAKVTGETNYSYTLPIPKTDGEIKIIKKIGNGNIIVYPDYGHNIYNDFSSYGTSVASSVKIDNANAGFFIYSATLGGWISMKLGYF